MNIDEETPVKLQSNAASPDREAIHYKNKNVPILTTNLLVRTALQSNLLHLPRLTCCVSKKKIANVKVLKTSCIWCDFYGSIILYCLLKWIFCSVV